MVLRLVENGSITDVPIRAGEILLLPAQVPHSPQRFADSVGLVIERRRRPGELDGLQWYCEHCQRLLYQEFFALTDIERQFPPVFQRFFGDLSLRTCKHCGSRDGAAGNGGGRPWHAMSAPCGRGWTSTGCRCWPISPAA